MITTNEYFDAQVKSLGYSTASGNSTIGVMEAGDYEFGTSSHESTWWKPTGITSMSKRPKKIT